MSNRDEFYLEKSTTNEKGSKSVTLEPYKIFFGYEFIGYRLVLVPNCKVADIIFLALAATCTAVW